MTPSTFDPFLIELGHKDVLLPNNATDLKKAINIILYKKMPSFPAFIYKALLQTIGGNKEKKAQLLDAMVIGSNNSQPLPAVNQDVLIVWGMKDRFFRLEEAHLLQRHIGEKVKIVVITSVWANVNY